MFLSEKERIAPLDSVLNDARISASALGAAAGCWIPWYLTRLPGCTYSKPLQNRSSSFVVLGLGRQTKCVEKNKNVRTRLYQVMVLPRSAKNGPILFFLDVIGCSYSKRFVSDRHWVTNA